MGLTKTQSGGLEDQSVTLDKLPHGDGSSDGKFLRANNGADPTFETVSGTTINHNADNRVLTGTGTANTIQGESGLLFDGQEVQITNAQPKLKLIDTGVSNVEARVDGDGGNLIIAADHNNAVANTTMTFTIDQSEKLRIDSSGRVGIGTSSPGDKLHVNGTTNLAGNSYLTNAYVSGSIYLGGTGSANEYDDYEEGTWTPTWAPASGSINTLTAWGNYVKIGRVVHCMFAISANGSSGESGTLNLGGLPFNADIPSANGIRGGGGVAFPGAAQNQNITKVVANGSDIYVLLADNSFLQTNSSGISYGYNAAQLSGMFTYLTAT
jgi:hypothetical protein